VIVIGTGNRNKVVEIAALPAAQGLELSPAASFGTPPEIVEDGQTFLANAEIKALAYSTWLLEEYNIHPLVLAEDSGLEVDALSGWPGVNSARTAPTNEERIQLVLDKLTGVDDRRARFVAVTVLAEAGKVVGSWEGSVEGAITSQCRGDSGFGYDPVFEIVRLGKTFAELGRDMKNTMSHRTKAWTSAFNDLRSRGLLPDRRALSRDVEMI